MMLLELSSLKEFKLMRNAHSRTTRKAELHPRRLFDFISPTIIGMAIITYVAFVLLVLYIRQFEFPWFGGYWNIVTVTAANLFFAGVGSWYMYGQKLNLHQAYQDRMKHIELMVKILVFTSIAATMFIALSVVLAALDLRHLQSIAQCLYLQLLAVICLQAYYRSDLPPRTSPPSKLDLGPLEVHSPEQNRVLVTWGVWPPAPEADRPRRCEAVSGCTPFATSRLAPLLPTTCRRSLH